MVERQLPKLNVAGSIPVSRSSNFPVQIRRHHHNQIPVMCPLQADAALVNEARRLLL